MSRIVVVGIDGLDWPVLEPLLDELPVMREIGRKGHAGEMPSVFPPDSIPSWVSIFTGYDPSEHGVLDSIDYFKKGIKRFAVDTGAFRGKTFWDLAGERGKKVIVVNPLLAYPPWDVNGVMASGPVFISGEAMATPKSLAGELELPPLGGIVDFPEKGELTAFARKSHEETLRTVEFTVKLMESRDWDLVFVSILTLDRIFHFFWRYHDTGDPTHPRSGRHAGVIREFHKLLDDCIGMLQRSAGDDTIFMILSDHGHGMRPPSYFNLNQLLLEHGLLESRIKGPKFLHPRYLVDRAKNFTLETLHRLDMEDLAYRIAHILPWTRKLKKGDFLTEPTENLATASEFGGNNPFGGIAVSRKRCSSMGLEYEELRDRIIALLLGTSEKNGEPVFLWAKRREELFSGPHTDKFPDILYEMRPEYGTNWSLHVPLVTRNPRHRKISGGHRKDSVMIVGPLHHWRIDTRHLSPLNIASTIVHLLTERTPDGHDPAGTVKNRCSFLVRD
ncbi:MAG: alkaline phosphatase family protein [bacterium]|nr:MAG: alkaline phosphatase family protein [bacterium]